MSVIIITPPPPPPPPKEKNQAALTVNDHIANALAGAEGYRVLQVPLKLVAAATFAVGLLIGLFLGG